MSTEVATQTPKFESTLRVLLAHPTRVAAYVILVERTASPVEIAHELGKPVGHVGYHVRKLIEIGQIEMVGERPVRGAVEHFYRAIKRPYCGEEEWAKMSPAERDALTRLTLQLHLVDVSTSVDAGTFDARMNRWLLRLPMPVMDEEGFDELADLYARMYEESLQIMGRAANRSAEDPDRETFPAVLTAMFFERPRRQP